MPRLIPQLRDPDSDVRKAVAATLEHYGPHARLALPELRRAVTVGDAEVRKAAISAILAMGTEIARPAIPTLIEALSDETDTVRRVAAEGLGQFGADARAAIPALTKMEEGDNADDRKAATNAILKILGPPK